MEPIIVVAIVIALATLGARFGADSRSDELNWPGALCRGCTTKADFYRSEWRPRDG